MRSRAGTSSMRTIDLPGEILAEDLQESEKRPGRILEKGGMRTPGPVRSMYQIGLKMAIRAQFGHIHVSGRFW